MRLRAFPNAPSVRGGAARTRRIALLTGLIAGLISVLVGGGCDLQKTLDDLGGKPSATSAVGTVPQPAIAVPSGPMLYCITNIGHTLEVYSLAQGRLLPETRTYLELDPVGPWFSGGRGYYVSRVNTNGAGSNALIEFDPRTAQPGRRYTFPANSNPNSLLILAATPDAAWVPLRGSTFDGFRTNAIAVVRNLAGNGPLTAQAFDLNLLGAGGTATVPGLHLTSLIRLLWDGACPAANGGGGPCVYAVVNNYDETRYRQGWLLALQPDPSTAAPVLLDAVPLGLNPVEDLYLDAARQQLWIVNNGGYAPLPPAAGSPTGSLQVIATPQLGAPGAAKTVATVPAGFAPQGLFALNAGTAWMMTYPSDVVLPVDLAAPAVTLAPSPALPTLTGPLMPTTLGGPGLFAGKGGFGPARLVSLSTAGAVLQDLDLQAGNGPVDCAEYQVP